MRGRRHARRPDHVAHARHRHSPRPLLAAPFPGSAAPGFRGRRTGRVRQPPRIRQLRRGRPLDQVQAVIERPAGRGHPCRDPARQPEAGINSHLPGRDRVISDPQLHPRPAAIVQQPPGGQPSRPGRHALTPAGERHPVGHLYAVLAPDGEVHHPGQQIISSPHDGKSRPGRSACPGPAADVSGEGPPRVTVEDQPGAVVAARQRRRLERGQVTQPEGPQADDPVIDTGGRKGEHRHDIRVNRRGVRAPVRTAGITTGRGRFAAGGEPGRKRQRRMRSWSAPSPGATQSERPGALPQGDQAATLKPSSQREGRGAGMKIGEIAGQAGVPAKTIRF